MIIKAILFAIIPTFIAAQSSCSNYWQYVRGSGRIEGLLTLKLNNIYSDHHIKIVLSIGARLQGSYVGDINLVKDKQSVLNDISYGQLVQLKVRFPILNSLPKLLEVYYNNQRICVGTKDSGSYIATITLEHTISNSQSPQTNYYNINSNNAISSHQSFNPNYQNTQENKSFLSSPPVRQNSPPAFLRTQAPTWQQTFIPQTRQLVQLPTIPSARQSFQLQNRFSDSYSDNECGISHQALPDALSLVINGRPAVKGQFPWLAAYFHNGVKENGFICGGSLVSTKSVITAAHCIHNKNEFPKRAEEALFYVGKYFIDARASEKDFIISPVTQFIIHPDWKTQSSSYDGDIAIVILARTVEITDFIRPICLWTSSNNYNDLVHQIGVIVGYGKTDAFSQASDRPYYTSLPVVDEGTCLRSNPTFLKITSKRTFCAGNRDGRGPCQGDSGGGLIVKNNGKWYLRGIVSSSLIDRALLTCDTKNYAVFTDVAAYKDWIQRYI